MKAETLSQSDPQTPAEFKAAFERLMAEADSINERMGRERIEIERLQAETNAWRDETRAILVNMDVEQSVQKTQWEQQHDRDIAARERENMMLRLENTRLRANRDLPHPLFDDAKFVKTNSFGNAWSRALGGGGGSCGYDGQAPRAGGDADAGD